MFHCAALITLLSTASIAYGMDNHNQLHSQHSVHQNASLGLKMLTFPLLKPGKTTVIQFQLLDKNKQKVITEDALKEVHTQKLHLLIIDPSLTDYHHIHPTVDSRTGSFTFDFTPKKKGIYRIWADITPTATNQQEYLVTEIGTPTQEHSAINKTLNHRVDVDGYTFELALNGKVQAGKATMASITVTKNHKPFQQLEPVMGAFAHLVGFTEDFNSVVHIHPMGEEPSNDSDRGGPKLVFHMEPKTTGFMKLFAQVRIDGKDLFVPFGIMVN